MDVLHNMVVAVKADGVVLDLQVIRPNPVVETGGRVVCEIDGEPLLRIADAAVAAIDASVRAGILAEEAVDDHEVREHYSSGLELIDDFAGKVRKLPDEALPSLRALLDPCAVRERCRVRRLRVH